MDFFHIVNRGVDKRKVFMDDIDRVRFMQNLYIYNDQQYTPHNARGRKYREQAGIKKKPLVHIHAFCLMDNHYHLLVSPIVENGISIFMHKVGMGYSKYFNEKYERDGALWQGNYKMIHITKDAHFIYIPYYIHLNPLDFKMREWRKGEVENIKKALDFLKGYRWSSYLDYIGINNFPSIIYKKDISTLIGSGKKQETTIKEILQSSILADSSKDLEM